MCTDCGNQMNGICWEVGLLAKGEEERAMEDLVVSFALKPTNRKRCWMNSIGGIKRSRICYLKDDAECLALVRQVTLHLQFPCIDQQ